MDMDTGAVTINMATKTKITIERVTKSTAIKAMGMMTATTGLCVAGTSAPESQDVCGSRCFPSGILASPAPPESSSRRHVNLSGPKERADLAAADVNTWPVDCNPFCQVANSSDACDRSWSDLGQP